MEAQKVFCKNHNGSNHRNEGASNYYFRNCNCIVFKRLKNISMESVRVTNIATKRLLKILIGIFLPSAENRGKCVSSSDSDSEFFSFNQPGCRLLIFLISEPPKRKRKNK